MSQRRKNDFYPTPGWATEVLLSNLPDEIEADSMVIYEPCSGQGDISNILKKKYPIVLTNDIDPEMPSDGHIDATLDKAWTLQVDWTITNPPFNQAYQIVSKAVKNSKNGVAALLRLSFLEPTMERGPWLAANPPDKMIVLPRISFTGDGKTDSVTCAWMIWLNKYPKYDRIIVKQKEMKKPIF